MEKLNAMLGEEQVLEIYLKAGRAERVKTETTPAGRCTRSLSATELQKIAEQTGSVSDPELRGALAELLARHMETDSTD